MAAISLIRFKKYYFTPIHFLKEDPCFGCLCNEYFKFFLDGISRNALSHVCCVLLHIVSWAKEKIQFDRRFGKMMLLLVALSIEMFWEAKKKIQGFEEIMVLKFQRKLRVSHLVIG